MHRPGLLYSTQLNRQAANKTFAHRLKEWENWIVRSPAYPKLLIFPFVRIRFSLCGWEEEILSDPRDAGPPCMCTAQLRGSPSWNQPPQSPQ